MKKICNKTTVNNLIVQSSKFKMNTLYLNLEQKKARRNDEPL